MIKHEELMPFKKFVQSLKGELYDEETININGTFKEIPSGKIIKNDIFIAHKIGTKTIKEIYKIYLEWFNHTKYENEEEREFVSVKLVKDEL
ncbi:MAG: hypothetical protein QQN41_08710 [Nitrosopumilus sp.]